MRRLLREVASGSKARGDTTTLEDQGVLERLAQSFAPGGVAGMWSAWCRPRRAIAGALAAAAAVVLAGCGEEREARFAASCAPDPLMEQLACTVQNTGTKAGRACLTARAQPEKGAPIIARRMCTGVLEPAQTAVVTPRFEQLPQARRGKTLASRCAKDGRWSCAVDIVETPRELGENLPGGGGGER